MHAPELRPLSIGETLDLAFGLYRRLFVPLVVVQVVCSSPAFLLALYQAGAGATGTRLWLTLAVYLFSIVLGALASAATVFLISERYLGRELRAGDALRRAVPFVLQLVGLSLMVALVAGVAAMPFVLAFGGAVAAALATSPFMALGLMLVGLLFLVLPVYVFSGLALGTQTLVLEPGVGPLRAMSRSWALTRGRRWRIVALLVVFFVILMVPLFGLGAVFGIGAGAAAAAGGPGAAGATDLVLTAATYVVTYLLTPLLYCILTLAYYDLRVRKEGFDLQVLAQSLGAAQPA